MIEERTKNLEECYAFRNVGRCRHHVVDSDSNLIRCTPVPVPQPLWDSTEIGVLHDAISNRFQSHICVVGNGRKVVIVDVAMEQSGGI